MNQILHFIRRQGVSALAYLAIVLALIAIFSNVIINKKGNENSKSLVHSYQILQHSEKLLSYIKDCQIGQCGYLLAGKEEYLVPHLTGKKEAIVTLETLKQLTRENPQQQQRLATVEKNLGQAFEFIQKTVDAVNTYGVDSAQYIILAKDDGKVVIESLWQNMADITKSETAILEASSQQFAAAKFTSQLIQVVGISLVIAVLVMLVISLGKIRRSREALFAEIDQRNNELILHSSESEVKEKDEKYIVERLITNLQRATEFIRQIGQGKYDVEMTGFSSQYIEQNQHNLAGSLMHMREQLKRVAEEDRKRNWATAGQAKFAEILRENTTDIPELSLVIITNLVKYLNANQGGLFVLNKEDVSGPQLEMVACYAYERKKFLKKTVMVGEGLIGQCVQEADTIYLTDIPQDYVNITSGLGSATPTSLLIVPLKLNDEVYGVVEIASFHAFEIYQIEYVEKVAESIASTLSMVKVNDRTKKLLEEAQQAAEMMRSQEEEMRQNMEELQATQEEMQRKQNENNLLLDEAQQKERLLQEKISKSDHK